MKKEIYFITATNTNIGKTKASEVFLKKFAKQGKKVGYFKPIETGVINTPIDASSMLKLVKTLNDDFKHIKLQDVVPYTFELAASPFVANKDFVDININTIKNKITYLLQYCDILIIEGAGGLFVPIKKNYFMIDLIKNINPSKTILIVPSYLGSINETLLNINLLENENIDFKWYINLFKDKDEFEKITLPFYKAYFDKISFLQ